MSLKIHHVGYMIKKISRTLPQFTELEYEVEIPEFKDESRKCDFCFLIKDGYRIELISPWGEESPLFPMLKHHKNMMYHICYETDSMQKEIERLNGLGIEFDTAKKSKISFWAKNDSNPTQIAIYEKRRFRNHGGRNTK